MSSKLQEYNVNSFTAPKICNFMCQEKIVKRMLIDKSWEMGKLVSLGNKITTL